MKKAAIVLTMCLAFAAVALAGNISLAKQKVADVIIINDPLFTKHKKPPVTFSHDKHHKDYKIDCAACHHIYKDGKNVFKQGDPVQACSKCHTKAKNKDPKNLGLYEAFHKNCKGCHKAEKKKGNKKAPTKCSQCHVKK